MKEKIELSTLIPSTPEVIYNAWLTSESHSLMTGGEAKCSNIEGAPHSAWDGYIWGSNIKLTPFSEIQQTWRTSEFSDEDEDSHITVQLFDHEERTELKLIHTNIPEGQTQYETGWKEHYFEPMKLYFGSND